MTRLRPVNAVFGAVLFAALTLALVGCAQPGARSGDRGAAIADQVMKNLGGKERWDSLRGIRWSFGSEVGDTIKNVRRHSWDKFTGWHRVEGKMRDGTPFLFIDNIGTGEGRAWMNGNEIHGDSLKKLLTRAKSLWTNDTYWMLMPYKLRDPGVNLIYGGEVKDPAGSWDKLAMTFDQVGETPGDHYWVYVNRGTKRVDKWDMVLEGDPPPPVSYTWEGWEQHGGLWFATAHRQGDRNVFTRDIETVSEFEPTEFSAP